MNTFWLRIIAFGLLLMLVLAPFAGFAPLFLIILVAGAFWFLGSILQVLVFGESKSQSRDATNE
ncbi:hypothetical protein [Myxosarcina sp. GI1]|uniref:hypothetical protein n=1 Tax=Myxosarcina sp. GI1 TaxID=1541065 RepID=UPI000569F11A|nr:hypothetical protein [Myxosarcina sp. GI1]